VYLLVLLSTYNSYPKDHLLQNCNPALYSAGKKIAIAILKHNNDSKNLRLVISVRGMLSSFAQFFFLKDYRKSQSN
jgi:hypothetical protein